MVFWFDHNSEHQGYETLLLFFLQLFVTLPCLKNYALQTRIPNREKTCHFELEIALSISSVLKRVTRENRPVFC